ncbi:hypothetical protein [Coraliomargarita sinensis]|uniref:hypothetical protein n=1 Tax=Coraliomargarita sinensis TaxID=2174842 RepID=UPI001304C46A|nr:hypothetical protein [Coraliomargarita sinensis]
MMNEKAFYRSGSACGCLGFVEKPQFAHKGKHRLNGDAGIRKRSRYGQPPGKINVH